MLDLGGNLYQCEKGDNKITITFRPTEPRELSIEYMEDGASGPTTLQGLEWTRTLGNDQVDLHVFYVFVPGSTSSCRIFVKGEVGSTHENRPAAQDLQPSPEHRIYSFLPFQPSS